MTDNAAKDVELVITRTLQAPRELVYQVWTEPAHLAKWWGPKGFAIEVASFDLRPGGMFHYSMTSADGLVMWGKFVFSEIEAPEKLVLFNSFSDEEGNTVRAPFSPAFPLQIENTVTLEDQNGQTLLTLRSYPANATAEELAFFKDMHSSMQQGFGGTFDQLAEYLDQAAAQG